MPTPTPQEPLEPIADEDLERVAGGTKHKNSDVTAAITAIQSSLKDLGNSRNAQTDPMQMILMMMMMGGLGGGGGGGVVAAPAAVATPPVINIDTAVSGGGTYPIRRGGKKGW